MEPVEPSEASKAGGQAGKAASRTLSGKAFALIVLPGAAGLVLIWVVPGLDAGTRSALNFILVPVVVTPLLGSQAGLNREVLIVGSVLGGEIAAALYAAGQYHRFLSWLIAVEFAALLLASRTRHMLRVIPMPIPGVPLGEKMSARAVEDMPTRARIARFLGIPLGVTLLIVCVPFALLAGFLDAMARFPVAAILGALLGVIGGLRGVHPVWIAVGVLLALLPAAIRWVIVRARQPPEP